MTTHGTDAARAERLAWADDEIEFDDDSRETTTGRQDDPDRTIRPETITSQADRQ